MYDPHSKGSVSMNAVREVLPIDPRISVLLQQLVHAVAGCREVPARASLIEYLRTLLHTTHRSRSTDRSLIACDVAGAVRGDSDE